MPESAHCTDRQTPQVQIRCAYDHRDLNRKFAVLEAPSWIGGVGHHCDPHTALGCGHYDSDRHYPSALWLLIMSLISSTGTSTTCFSHKAPLRFLGWDVACNGFSLLLLSSFPQSSSSKKDYKRNGGRELWNAHEPSIASASACTCVPEQAPLPAPWVRSRSVLSPPADHRHGYGFSPL